MKKTAIIIIFLTIISKILGFLRDLTLSYFYGTSYVSDAYIVSLTIPIVIFGFIGAGVSAGFIPMYTKIEKQFGRKTTINFTENLTTVLMIICTIIIAVSFIFAEQIVNVFASGLEGESLKLAIALSKISIFSIYFTGLVYIFSGLLQLNGKFGITSLIGLPYNVIIISFIILSSYTSVYALGIGSILAAGSQILFLYPFIRKQGIKYKFSLDYKNKHLKEMLIISLPIMMGVSVNHLNILIDRTLASQIGLGSLSSLYYASTLNTFMQGVFVFSLATLIYPLISKLAAESKIEELKKILSQTINIVIIVIVPASIVILLFSETIVSILYGRGAFGSKEIASTSTALFFYSFGMIGLALREILTRVFFALGNTKTPMLNSVIALIINIILNFILSKYMGIAGLALATSISALIAMLLIYRGLSKSIGSLNFRKILSVFTKTLVASLLLGFIGKFIFLFLINEINMTLSFFISVILFLFIYLIALYLLRVEELKVLIKGIKKRR